MQGDHPLYLLSYFALIIFFTYFYVAITFNPVEVADNMKKYGGFIPGHPAGSPDGRVPRATCCRASRFPGSLFLGIICVLPLGAAQPDEATSSSRSAAPAS